MPATRDALAPVTTELSVEDITWALRPVDEPEPKDILTEALIDTESYRLIAQAALQSIRELTIRNDQLRQAYLQVIQECRTLRGHTARRR